MFCIFTSIICLWIIFFDGAEKLENTMLGYFEFGLLAEKAHYIKILAWLSLIISVALLVRDLNA